MTIANVHEAETPLSQLLDLVEGGEEVVIARAGQPVARLVPYENRATPRRGGSCRGWIRIGKDFDALLPDEVAAAFRGDPAGQR